VLHDAPHDVLAAGDVWYFPANLPHSFVGLEPDGCMFVSGYKSPDFDELRAFSASSWLATLSVETLAQVVDLNRLVHLSGQIQDHEQG
jgi:ribosomal protein L16 Arg81 hydroxylase